MLSACSVAWLYGRFLRMQKAIEVVYTRGVLKPLETLELEEGAQLTLLLLPAINEHAQEGYTYLVARDHPRRRQLYVKERNLTVGQLVRSIRADHLLPADAAERYDLPLAAIEEALAYYQAHRELIEAEAEAEKRYLLEKGYPLEPQDLS
ncbi:MAG: DUF104 domain-containing protein [Deltaproteobacteria bacterium]|nr:DUF104 domain-containing protein [Deltaproteobacteria bacterium]